MKQPPPSYVLTTSKADLLAILPVWMTCPDCKRWILCRFIPQPNGKKPRKVPYYTNGKPRSGKTDTQEDIEQMASFDEAYEAFAKGGFTCLGFALGPDDKGGTWQGVDFDHYKENTHLSGLMLPGYVERSPSGNGFHAIGYGQKFHALGDNKSGIEAYSGGRYFTVTGDECGILFGLETPKQPIDLFDYIKLTLLPLHALHGTKASSTTLKAHPEGLASKPKILETLLPETMADLRSGLFFMPADDYEFWIAMGQALRWVQGGLELWDEWSATSTKYDADEIKRRWAGFAGDHTGYKAVFARAKANGWVNPRRSVQPDPTVVFAKGQVIDSISDPGNELSRFALISAQNLAILAHPPWIIKNILPQAELAMVFGASGSGKSFLVLDLVAAIARGEPWQGNKVRQGKVVYIVAEGAGGFQKRILAYAEHHKVDLGSLDFYFIPSAPNLLTENDLLELSKEIGQATAIVIDTLACTSPGGDENSSTDMGKVLANCKLLHQVTHALIILVHHSGKDSSKGARGWSGLRAAVDAEIEISRNGAHSVMSITKLKDGEDGKKYNFHLLPIALGKDDDGDPITSCVIEFIDAPTSSKAPKGKWQIAVVKAVNHVIKDGKALIEKVIDSAINSQPKPAGRDHRRSLAKRALATLENEDHWKIEGEYVITP